MPASRCWKFIILIFFTAFRHYQSYRNFSAAPVIMKSQMLSASILIFGCWVAAANAAGSPCIPQFKNIAALTATGEMCTKKMLSLQNTTAGATSHGGHKHVGDMCVANCTLTELNVFTNGTIQKDALIAMINENAPDAAKAQLTTLVGKCADKATKKGDGKTKISPKFKAQAQGQDKKMDKMHKGKMCCHVASKFMKCFTEGDKMC